MTPLAPSADELRRLTRTDPDPPSGIAPMPCCWSMAEPSRRRPGILAARRNGFGPGASGTWPKAAPDWRIGRARGGRRGSMPRRGRCWRLSCRNRHSHMTIRSPPGPWRI